MLRNFFVSLLFVCSFFQYFYAQQAVIVASRNEVYVQKTDGTWCHAAAGAQLKGNQKIRIGAQSYLALVFENNKSCEVKKQGLEYQLNDKASNCIVKQAGYILNQAIASGAGRESGRTLGAVTRHSMAPLPLTEIPAASLPTLEKSGGVGESSLYREK